MVEAGVVEAGVVEAGVVEAGVVEAGVVEAGVVVDGAAVVGVVVETVVGAVVGGVVVVAAGGALVGGVVVVAAGGALVVVTAGGRVVELMGAVVLACVVGGAVVAMAGGRVVPVPGSVVRGVVVGVDVDVGLDVGVGVGVEVGVGVDVGVDVEGSVGEVTRETMGGEDVAGPVDGEVSGLFLGGLAGTGFGVVCAFVVVEEPIDGTIGLVEEVGVVVDDDGAVKEARATVATALPATPRYSHETVMDGTAQVTGHGKVTGKPASAALEVVAVHPPVPVATTCQSVPAGCPIPS